MYTPQQHDTMSVKHNLLTVAMIFAVIGAFGLISSMF